MIRVTLSQSGLDWTNQIPIGTDISREDYEALASRTIFVRDGYSLDLSEETDVGFTYDEIVGQTIGTIRFLFPAENESDFKQLTVASSGPGDFVIPGSRSFEDIVGGDGNDTLDDGEAGGSGGGGYFDVLYGGAGNDTYLVHSIDTELSEEEPTGGGDAGGNDRIITTTGYFIRDGVQIETLILTEDARFGAGNDFANTVIGDSASTNFLMGRGGNDVLTGGDLDDVLIGGLGSDRLTGGDGSDAFLFDGERGGRDSITDFSAEDILVTSTKIFDSNGDGIITFGRDRAVTVGTTIVTITSDEGKRITALEYDGTFTINDRTFHAYSRVGSAANAETAAAHDYSDIGFFGDVLI